MVVLFLPSLFSYQQCLHNLVVLKNTQTTTAQSMQTKNTYAGRVEELPRNTIYCVLTLFQFIELDYGTFVLTLFHFIVIVVHLSFISHCLSATCQINNTRKLTLKLVKLLTRATIDKHFGIDIIYEVVDVFQKLLIASRLSWSTKANQECW